MVPLVRSLLIIVIKVILFVVLFVVSARVIYFFIFPMPAEHQHQLFVFSEKIGINDLEDFYLLAEVIINLIAATIEFILVTKVCRKVKEKWGHSH